MIIGFTGTQRGISPAQRTILYGLLSAASELHHGDCVGSDAAAHNLARLGKAKIVIHPPMATRKRAFCQGDTILEPKPYLVRNHDIVDASDTLVATPSGPHQIRSGTWATVRYARKQKKLVIVVYPDGSVE